MGKSCELGKSSFFQLPFLYGIYIKLLICMPILNPFLFKKNILNPFLLHCNFLGLVAIDILYVHRRTMRKVLWVENLSGLNLDAYWPYVFSHMYQCMIVSLWLFSNCGYRYASGQMFRELMCKSGSHCYCTIVCTLISLVFIIIFLIVSIYL